MESQFPPSAVNDAIEDCLSDLEAYLKTLNHADFKIHINALKAAKMEAHMKMGDLATMLWREVVDQSYDFRRHHRECEHLNFLTLSKVRSDNLSNILNGSFVVVGPSVLQAIYSPKWEKQTKVNPFYCT